jgi:hypothetical protein
MVTVQAFYYQSGLSENRPIQIIKGSKPKLSRMHDCNELIAGPASSVSLESVPSNESCAGVPAVFSS